MAQYFTDPIFYPNQRQSWEKMYYPYFGSEFFRTMPIHINLGTAPIQDHMEYIHFINRLIIPTLD